MNDSIEAVFPSEKSMFFLKKNWQSNSAFVCKLGTSTTTAIKGVSLKNSKHVVP